MGRGLAIQNPLYGYEIDIQHLKNLIFPQLGLTTIAMMMTRMEAWVGGNSNIGAGARWIVGWRLSAPCSTATSAHPPFLLSSRTGAEGVTPH